MSNKARGARRRLERANVKLERKVSVALGTRTPTERFGHDLDAWAQRQGRRIRIGRTFRLGKWRTLVVLKAERLPRGDA